MDQYGNQRNPDGTDDNRTNNQETERKAPEYNFWAEQIPNGSYSNYDPNNNSLDYGNNVLNNNEESHKKPGNKTLKFILKAIFFGVIAGISFIGLQILYYQFNPDAVQSQQGNYFDSAGNSLDTNSNNNFIIETTKPGKVKLTQRSVISDVVNSMMPSIVSINSVSTETGTWFGQEFSQDVEGSGSGIIVEKNDNELLIVTNNHVVAGTNKITVTFIDDKVAEAVIKGTDATADLAVITVDLTELEEDTLNAIDIAILGDSDKVKVGEMAVAIGNALGYGQSVTVGYVSAKDREVNISDGYNYKTMVLLQTDAAINPGNSGGALLNINGEVIGINTVKYASSSVEGMGYAIPISRATPIINELMSREILNVEEQGFIGIQGQDVTEDIASMLNMPLGVYVKEIIEEGAAEEAGLLEGDVIIDVNDIEITSITQLREYVTSLRVGTQIKVTYMRNIDGSYEEKVANIELGMNPTLK